jgi:hypothetical protein
MMLTASQEKRFLSRVLVGEVNECWPWTGRIDQDGYGRFDVDGRPQLAHRIAWTIEGGKEPWIEGEVACVLHRCDNPPCCNPFHLFLGTRADNNADMRAKGRSYTGEHAGELNSSAKLTENKVRDIAARLLAGETGTSIAEEYGVSNALISQIRLGKKWAHLPVIARFAAQARRSQDT